MIFVKDSGYIIIGLWSFGLVLREWEVNRNLSQVDCTEWPLAKLSARLFY